MAVPTDSPEKKQIAAARAGTKRKQPPSCTSEGKALAFQGPAGSVHAPAPKQNKSPGVRLVGGRIYDSEHGKTCHQCRQKTMDFAAACSNSRSLKPCRIHFCHKCLLNRYGEKAEEMAARGDWICPKCRGICNCSFCMKKRGQQPTGILIHAAKAIGCSSVSEMLRLHHTSSELKRVNKDENATPDNPPSSVEKTVASERNRVMGNSRGSKGSLEFDRRASEFMEEKTAVLESVKRNVKGENGSGPASDLRSGRKHRKRDFLERRMPDECSGKLGKYPKKHNVTGERRSVWLENNEKLIGILEMNSGRDDNRGEAQLLHGSNVDDIKGDFPEKISKKLGKKYVKKEEMARMGYNRKHGSKLRRKIRQDDNDEGSQGLNGRIHDPRKGYLDEKISKKVSKKHMDVKTGAVLDGNEEKEFLDGDGNGVDIEGLPRACEGKKRVLTRTNVSHSAVAMPQGTELIRDADIKLQVETDGLLRDCKEMKHVFTSTCAPPDSVFVMPKGTALITVAGIEFQVEDVGPALQFLEFCSAFGKLLDIKEGQPESILRELASGRGVRRGLNSKIVQLYIKLLSRIREERGDRSLSCTENDGTWLKALQKCVAEAQFDLDDLDLDSVTKCTAGYATLDSSKKLRLLNFLCDELLGTKEVRSLINTENTNFDEKNKEEREKLLAANEEKKILKKKLKDEVVEAMLELRNGAPLTVSEHEDLISKIKTELEKAHAEVLGSLGSLCKKRSDAVRTEPIRLEGDGRAYWRLKGYNNARILLQDISDLGSTVTRDQWFIYSNEQEKIVEKHLSSSRTRFC